MLSFEMLVNNAIATGAVRYDTLEGREHIVAPMVMITEGVHAGSNGPLLYEPGPMEESVPAWNHKPVVVYHPQENGQHVSACSPAQLNARKVGLILNTRFDRAKIQGHMTHRLPAEAWLDVKRVVEVDERIMAALESNTPMEVSTGLFHKPVAKTGVWNGKGYTAAATAFAPDHLALLPDKPGACGIADGAGLLLNEASDDKIRQVGLMPFVRKAMQEVWDTYALNQKSFGNITEDLVALLRERFTGDPWVVAVYKDFVVYEQGGHYWKLPYKIESDVVMVPADAKPEQVVRVTEYRTLEGQFVGNTSTVKEVEPMKRSDLVTGLIANGQWTEADRAFLEAAPEAQFARLAANTAAPAPAPAPAATTPEATPAPAPAAAPVANSTPQTPEQVMASLPPQMRAVIANGMQALERETVALIGQITANAAGVYTEPELRAMELPALQKLAQALSKATPAPVANQFGSLFGLHGNGGVHVGNGGTITANDAGDVPVLARTQW